MTPIGKAVNKYYNRLFSNYISPKRYEQLCIAYSVIPDLSWQGKVKIVNTIKELIETDHKIITGYAVSSQKNYSYRVLFYKKKFVLPKVVLSFDYDSDGTEYIWRNYRVCKQDDYRLIKYAIYFKDNELVEVTPTLRQARKLILEHYSRIKPQTA